MNTLALCEHDRSGMQDAPQEANPKKLYVGNLPWSATEEQVKSLFSEHGTLTDVALITDRMTGRSKGIAFVTFETEEEAQAAINALNGHELDGREIVVNVARPRAPRDNNRGGYNRGGNRGGGYNRDNRGGNSRY